MKKIFVVLFLAAFPCLAAQAEDKAVMLQKVDSLGQAADACAAKQKEKRDDAEKRQSNTDIQGLNYELVDCFREIADEAFEEFYPEKVNEMKQSFANFIQAAYEFNGDMYGYNKTCYQPAKHDTCGLVANQLSTNNVVKYVRDAVLRILTYTENRLKVSA